jgi:hypothetical protein
MPSRGHGTQDHLALRAAVQSLEDETPAAGTPRSDWTDVQKLLAVAYQLGDLADALENGEHPDGLPLAETRAHVIGSVS